MTKHTITRLFIGSLLALAGGLVLLAVAGAMAWANGSLVMDGPDVVGVRAGPLGWVVIGLVVVGALVVVAAGITQFVAWIGAILDTAQYADKTLFIVLLVTGLLSFGLVGMIVYLIAAPSTPRRDRNRPPSTGLLGGDGTAPAATGDVRRVHQDAAHRADAS